MKTPFPLFILVWLFCATSGALTAQKQRYADHLGSDEEIVDYGYQFVLSKHPEGRFTYRCFQPEEKLLIDVIHYTNRSLIIAEGLRERWFDNGNKCLEATYERGFLHGAYREYFYETGTLHTEGAYDIGEKHGPWRTYHPNGQLWKEEFYVKGSREGVYSVYDSLGVTKESGLMTADKVELRSVGEPPVAFPDDRLPEFPGCEAVSDPAARRKCADKKLLEYVYGKVRYPARARRRGVQGEALADFIVEPDGSVADVRVLHGLNADISREIERLILKMPVWHPGRQGGEAVRVRLKLPINFKL